MMRALSWFVLGHLCKFAQTIIEVAHRAGRHDQFEVVVSIYEVDKFSSAHRSESWRPDPKLTQ